ncbi:MAG: protein translocase subunit SecD [Planctomycetota bacterium]
MVERPDAEEPEVEETYSRFLPLALGDRTTETTVVERRDDGTVVKQRDTFIEGRIKLGLDIAGGTELVYELKPAEGQEFSGELDNTIEVLKQRIDPQNVKEFRIQAVGDNRVLIQVPRATQAEVRDLKNRLTRMGRLEFKLAMPRDEAQFQEDYKKAEEGKKVSGYEKMYVEDDESKQWFLVKEGEPEITGESLANVNISRDQKGGPAVGFQFDSQGRARFSSITERNRGWHLAIILDGELKSAPAIRSRIPGKGIIEGDFTMDEVNEMVTVLRAGSLPVDLELLQESTVGPKLGRDAIARGLNAILAGGLIVLLFIGIYYLKCGLVADGALLLNLVLLVGVLGVLGAALTLPGVAGILLTVGMAVDANVLIFERIREESEAGKTVHVALRNGYERAYTTIIDANVTTLLTAVILYMIGTGPVRGFAITLSAGLVLSMFTALYVTRLALETAVSREWLEEFRMFNLVGTPDIPYSRWRRTAFAVSGAVVVVGLVVFFSRGADLYDVDFTGGSLVQLSFDEPVSAGEVRDKLADGGYTDAQVQGTGPGGRDRSGESTDFRVRIKGVGRGELSRKLRPQLADSLRDAEIMGEKGRLRIGSDGRSLELMLEEGVDETRLRESLEESDGEASDLQSIDRILAQDEVESDRFLVRVRDIPRLTNMMEVWSDMLRMASFARVRRDAISIDMDEVESDGDGAARMAVELEEPVQWQVLNLELVRREFSNVEVVEEEDATQTFELRGDAERLEALRSELPRELNIPVISFDGPEMTMTLDEELTETDIRAYADRFGLDSVEVVPLDVKTRHYVMELSQDPIKQRLNDVFADMGGRSVSVSDFTVRDDEPDEDGRVLVSMEFSPAQPLSVVEYFLEMAGFAGEARDMIVERPDSPNVQMSNVNLRIPEGEVERAEETLVGAFEEAHPVRQITSIGAVVAREMKGRALLAVLCAAVVIVFYVALRFHAIRYGVAAVVAVVHDVIITAGIIAIADWTGVVGDIKINLAMLAAFLTILGYSLNDSIVVFDRIRENTLEAGKKALTADLIDLSLNQVLSRTILTSLTTLFAVLTLYLFGGAELRGLAFTLIIGIIVGTYSSVFIASPMLLDWKQISGATKQTVRIATLPIRVPLKLLGKLLG